MVTLRVKRRAAYVSMIYPLNLIDSLTYYAIALPFH
jgi:hypothetical protein